MDQEETEPDRVNFHSAKPATLTPAKWLEMSGWMFEIVREAL